MTQRVDTFPLRRKWRCGESHDVDYLTPLPHPIVILLPFSDHGACTEEAFSKFAMEALLFVRMLEPSAGFRSALFIFPISVDSTPPTQTRIWEDNMDSSLFLTLPQPSTLPEILPYLQIHPEAAPPPPRRNAYLNHLSYLDHLLSLFPLLSLSRLPQPVPHMKQRDLLKT